MISFMKYNTDIMYSEDIISCTRKNREKSICTEKTSSLTRERIARRAFFI